MQLFVTGGAGFIGSNYVHWLLANTDDSVVVFDALTYAGNLDNLRQLDADPRFRFVRRHPVSDRFMPWMATHWSVQADQRTIYFRLDPDARWS
ncbi:MAG: GDP-mannose 4,6-dehydratase, partial [Acidimicrobiales bacterium]|nr:GDP-mannose 4,6-dehydratase [Acidimicrobiales bacterium]